MSSRTVLARGVVLITSAAIGQLAGGHNALARPVARVHRHHRCAAVDMSRTALSVRTARRYWSAALRPNAFDFAGHRAGSLAILDGVRAVAAAGRAARRSACAARAIDELGDHVDLRWLLRRRLPRGRRRRGPGRPGIVGGQGIADAVEAHLVGCPASCRTIAPAHDARRRV